MPGKEGVKPPHNKPGEAKTGSYNSFDARPTLPRFVIGGRAWQGESSLGRGGQHGRLAFDWSYYISGSTFLEPGAQSVRTGHNSG